MLGMVNGATGWQRGGTSRGEDECEAAGSGWVAGSVRSHLFIDQRNSWATKLRRSDLPKQAAPRRCALRDNTHDHLHGTGALRKFPSFGD